MIAVLYDVHGNLPALEAAIADARGHGADRWVLGGDHVAFGGWPAETLALLRTLEGAQWIRGNTDRGLADDSELPRDLPQVPALARARETIGPEAVAELGALPERLSLAEAHFSHASPLNDMESFGPEPADDEDRLLDGVQAARFVFGHTHVQFERTRPDGIVLVNPGSVGMPLDGDHRAAYATIADDGALTLRRVAYDHERAAAAVDEPFASRIRDARL